MGIESKFVCVTVEHIIVDPNSPVIHLKMGSAILIQSILSQILFLLLSLGRLEWTARLIRSACVRLVLLDRILEVLYVYRQIFSFDFYLGFFKGSSKFRLFYTKIPLIPNSSEVCLYDTFFYEKVFQIARQSFILGSLLGDPKTSSKQKMYNFRIF